MAGMRNAQRAVVNSSAATISVVTNPSTTAFLYIWELALVFGGTSNITFNNAPLNQAAGAISGAMPMLASGSIFRSNFQSPAFTIDPGGSFTITNSQSVSVNGWVQYSN